MELFDQTPVISGRDYPGHLNRLKSARRRGLVWSPLPGIYAPSWAEDS